jgi:hypothetical protein
MLFHLAAEDYLFVSSRCRADKNFAAAEALRVSC